MANTLACNWIVSGIKPKQKQQINTAHGINFIPATWQDDIVILHCPFSFKDI